MPGYKGHIVGGTILYALILYPILYFMHPSWYLVTEWYFFLIAGALFPDVDTKSKGQYLFYYAVAALLLFLFVHRCYELTAICGILALVPLLVPHRGLFHQTWFVIMLPIIIAAVAIGCVPAYTTTIIVDTLFFIVGALSHLCLDRGIQRVFK